jgi:hypothetical protein
MCRICETNRLSGSCRFAWDADGVAAGGGARVELPAGLPESVSTAQAIALATLPRGVGTTGRRTLIRGGVVMSMDDAVGSAISRRATC